MDTVSTVRARPFDPTMDGALPATTTVRLPSGTAKLGVSREDAREFIESDLFTCGLAIISVSSWNDDRSKRPADYPEVLAALHQVFGADVLPKLRRVVFGGGAVYFVGLVEGSAFVTPTLLQDAALAKRYQAVPAMR